MGKREKHRRAAQADEAELHELYSQPADYSCDCPGCEARKHREYWERRDHLEFPSPSEYAEYLSMKAERRSQEAARKRREEQEREAHERLRKVEEKQRKARERKRDAEARKRAATERMKNERSDQAANRARQ
jgi:hypothetical protein